MSRLLALAVCASELSLDARVGAVRLIVPDLSAVVALAYHAAATFALLMAIASEVTGWPSALHKLQTGGDLVQSALLWRSSPQL